MAVQSGNNITYATLLPKGAASTAEEVQLAAYKAWTDGRSTHRIAIGFRKQLKRDDIRERHVIDWVDAERKKQ